MSQLVLSINLQDNLHKGDEGRYGRGRGGFEKLDMIILEKLKLKLEIESEME